MTEHDEPILGEAKRDPSAAKRDVGLWLGLLGPPLVYGLDLLLSYATVSVVAAHPHRRPTIVLHALTIVALLLTAGCGAISFRLVGRVREGRERFMALGGVATSAFFAIVVLANAVPKWMLRLGE